MGVSRDVIDLAWGRATFDCGCADVYFCPTSGDVECPRHSGFDVCCNHAEAHVLVPAETRLAHPRPRLPETVYAQEYTAMIGAVGAAEWTTKTTVWATSPEEARGKLEAKYGEGTVVSLWNGWDADRPR